jgi:predicted permease
MIWIVLTMAVSATAGAAFAHRRPHAAEVSAARIMNIVLWVFIPFVLFFNLVHFHISAKVGAALGLAYIGNLICVALAYLAARYIFKLTRPQIGAVMVCSLMGNTAYLGYPFVSAALGFDALPEAVSYDILVSVPFLLLAGFSIGAAFGTAADTPGERIKSYFTRNPLLYAAAIALVAPDSLSPQWAVDASRLLVLAILPLGFFAVGIVTWRESEDDKLGFPPPLTGPVAVTVILRLTVVAGFLLLIDHWVMQIPDAYMIEAAMAVGVNNLLLANNYGLDRKIAASSIVWSTMVVAVAGLVVEFV